MPGESKHVPVLSNIFRMIPDGPHFRSGKTLFSYMAMDCGTSEQTGDAYFLDLEMIHLGGHRRDRMG